MLGHPNHNTPLQSDRPALCQEQFNPTVDVPFIPSHDPLVQPACKDMIQQEKEDKTEKNELAPRERRATISIRYSSGSSFHSSLSNDISQ
jgi:hypothetical protein